ncbi:MAG: AAA family ATPase, partial [Thermomicrobiales bacterium]
MKMVPESPIERVLTRLEGVKRAGPGWMALCPAHDDRTPSLSITEGDDGRVLVKCFTGCEVSDIVAAIGLEQRDLFAEGRHAVTPRSRPVQNVDTATKPKPREVTRSVVATYAYVTRHGEIAYQVQRHRVEYADGTTGKTFTQRRPSGTGWVSNLSGVERILYRLPELAAAPVEARVHLPEGEKDADRLASLGLVATTVAQGANATLTSAMLDDLRGRNVVIWSDNDAPGRKAAQIRAEVLHGVAASVVVVLPPDLPDHGDVSDWLDAGNTLDDLNRLVGAAPEWQPGDTAKPDDGHSGLMLVTRSAANIEPREVEWLWPGWLPAGMLTLFAGYGGGGKSTVALGIAAAVSTGGTLPDGQRAPLGNVLYLAGEDTAEYTLIPRLTVHRANRSRIQIVDGIKQAGSDDPGWVQVREHVGHIEAEVCRIGARLLVIDPISSFIGDANGDRESDVRSALAPLGKMAERTGCAVLMIRHVSKGGGDGHRAASRILGSTAWHDLPRVAWMLGDAPDDQQPDAREDGTRDVRRVLGVVKSNLAAKPAPRWFVQPADGAMR